MPRQPLLPGSGSVGLLVVLALSLPVSAQTGVPGSFFSYLNGPNYCTAAPGFPAPALCTAPGEVPLGSFPLPSPGGTYIDPNFGATVRILTAAGQNRHAYSSPSVLSTTGKYALVTLNSTTTAILDTTTGAPVRQMLRTQRTWSSGEVVWDTAYDHILYYLSGYWNGVRWINDRLMRYDILADTETLIRDFAQGPYYFPWIMRGGTGDMSRDGWLPFYTPDQVCVVNVRNARTICATYTNAGGLPWTLIDFVSISKGRERTTRKHYVMMQGQPSNAMFELDAQRGRLTFLFRGPEMPYELMGNGDGDGVCEPGESCMGQSHSDTFEDAQGNQYLLRAVQLRSPCSWVLSSFRMAAGPAMATSGRTDVALLALCGTTPWPAMHIGCARETSYCAVTLENQPVLPEPVRNGAPYNGEIWVMRGNGLEFRRLAMHRSVIQSYYDQPRACISDNGRTVLWDSNYGVLGSQRVAVAGTGF
ncbi:MAG: hypothetical protein SFV51_12730 [Bryobacteraceae bacterium]|nr:hypothetical protein [Bryobacteraceae bacterium]